MLWPDSIAIVGASADSATIRGRILEYLLQRNYAGTLYLVSPTRPEIRGRRTHPDLASIGTPVDLALIAVRAEATAGILRECARIGVRHAICYSSGFAESGAEGAALQQELAEIAAATGMRIMGPNTAGFFNAKAGIPATFARNVDSRRPPLPSSRAGPGTVAIVAQSGGLGFAIGDRCRADHGLIVNSVVSTGNEADLEALDFVEEALEDSDTRTILLLVEALKDSRKLEAVAAHALEAGRPLVIAKFGRTEAGARAVGSHAARLTGADAVYDAVFRRHGLSRVDDEDEMVDLAAAFSLYPLPAGRRVGILTTSGGAGVWMADACEGAGLQVPVLDEATQRGLRRYVPSYGAIHNPVDLTAQVTVNPVGGAGGASPLVGALGALHDSPSVDAIVLVANMSDGDVLAREREGLLLLARRLKKPVLLYSHAPASPASLALVQELGLACFAGTRRVARAIAGMADYAEAARRRPPAAIPACAIPPADRELLAGGLCEYEAKALFARYGMPVGEERLATSAEEAKAIAAAFGAPVALKIQSRAIQHKTDVGGVMLGLADPAEIEAGYAALAERARAHAPEARLDGVLVQKMLPAGRELSIGIVQDPDFGPMMMVGMGGVFIEVLNDVALEPLPVRRDTALAMLRRLRGWEVLAGTRGQAPADVEAIAGLMEKLSRLIEGAGDACREIDLNPVFVYDAGKGAAIVDAIVVGRGGAPAGGR